MDTLKNIVENALDSLNASFKMLWSMISPILDNIALALLVLAIGYSLAALISNKLGILLKKVRIGDLLDRFIFTPIAKLTGVKVSASNVISLAVKWFLIATVLIAALDIAKMSVVIDFFNQAFAYVPNIIVAVLIVLVGSMLANLAATLVSTITNKDNLTKIARIGVNALALIAALTHLATPIVASFGAFISGLGLTKLQGDALFIGVLILVLLAGKKAVAHTVDNLHKG